MASSLPFTSRRSAVLGLRGMVASSQPLASEAGMRILQKGGNAADAAVAMAAALNVTEPTSTGIGGDVFALFWDASAREMKCLMGNGRSPSGLTVEAVRQRGITGTALPPFHALTVTVPGAAAAWEDAVKQWGRLPLSEVLQPAIELAEEGFPVSHITAVHWQAGMGQLQKAGGPGIAALLTAEGKAPVTGQLQRNPDLGATFRRLAKDGAAKGFYSGPVAAAIAEAVCSRQGVLAEADLAAHRTAMVAPISTEYKGHRVYEVPPPTQGVAALVAMNILGNVEGLEAQPWGGPARLHATIESMRLAFVDALQFNADPDVVHVPIDQLLAPAHAKLRRDEILEDKAIIVEPSKNFMKPGQEVPVRGDDTVYFCTVDRWGNGCSFINSNYMGFGTGIVPNGCGFTLQNRGANFIIDPTHPNCLAPRKRPFHTIIPAAATKLDAEGCEQLYAVFGVMGGFMQPQGHLQVLSNMVDFGMEPQAALDAPRFRLEGVDSAIGPASVKTSNVYLEEGFSEETIAELRRKGHNVRADESHHARVHFGRGQIIRRNPDDGVLWGGSDSRADGQAIGW